MHIKLIFVVLIILMIREQVHGFTKTEGTFELIPDTRIKTEYVFNTHISLSRATCSYKCVRNISCAGMSYNEQARLCEHWLDSAGTNLTAATENSIGWESWMLLSPPVDCVDIKARYPTSTDVVFYIKPTGVWIPVVCDLQHDGGGWTPGGVWIPVVCDLQHNGGGWTVFQRRFDGTTDFNRNMSDYKNGFGDIAKEFWLGLELLHTLTTNTTSSLYIELSDSEGRTVYELYDSFTVGQSPGYMLSLGQQVSQNITKISNEFSDIEGRTVYELYGYFTVGQPPGYMLSLGHLVLQNITSSDSLSFTSVCQFVSQVIDFSSEYGGSWSASQVVGEPNVYPNYGDIAGAWTPETTGQGFEYLQLKFNLSVQLSNITIYETYNSGAVKHICIPSSDGTCTVIWSVATVTHIGSSRAFTPSLTATDEFVSEIRIEFDTSMTSSYYEVDAVQICGIAKLVDPNTLQYNDKAEFTTHDEDRDEYTGNCADLHRGGWWFKSCTGLNPNGEYRTDGQAGGEAGSRGGIAVPGWQGFDSIKATKMMFRRQP